jgi:hypothetical protein
MNKKDAIKTELELISKKSGTLNPHDVVVFAKNPKTILHSCFTWDDTEAAQQWRLHQARMIIRVVVNVISTEDDEKEYRMFVSLRADRQAGIGYRPLISILGDEELKVQMLEEAHEEMQLFKEKYKDLKELTEVFVAMDKVSRKPLRRRIEYQRAEARV